MTLHEFHRRAESRGHALPAAITLGVHPLHYMGSMVYAYPPHVRKFEIIGGLFNQGDTLTIREALIRAGGLEDRAT